MHTSTPAVCEYCGYGHTGTCPKIKAIEYHSNGTVKRIEFHGPMEKQSVLNADDLYALTRRRK